MRNLILAILFFSLSFSQSLAITQGRLQNFSVATYAINNYQNSWLSPMNWGIDIADSLRTAMAMSIAAMNIYVILGGGTPTTLSTYAFENEDVIESNFLSSNAANYNFVFYYGHGNVDLITMWNSNVYFYNNHTGIGIRNTYWVWLNSCLVFRNGYANQEPWFDGVFKGAHSILGESSLSVNDYSSLQSAQNFAVRWIYNGNFFDPWEEKFQQAYLGPVFYNDDYTGIGSRWVTLGDPIYELP